MTDFVYFPPADGFREDSLCMVGHSVEEIEEKCRAMNEARRRVWVVRDGDGGGSGEVGEEG